MWSLDVKNDIMQLKSLQNFFKNGLMGYYPNEEIDTFFYRICSMHLKLKEAKDLFDSGIINSGEYEVFSNKYKPIIMNIND